MFTSETIINCKRCIKSESQCEMCEWNCDQFILSTVASCTLADDLKVLFI